MDHKAVSEGQLSMSGLQAVRSQRGPEPGDAAPAGGVEGVLRYPMLFKMGWWLFLGGSLYLAANALGFLLLLIHLCLDWRAMACLIKAAWTPDRRVIVRVGNVQLSLLLLLVLLVAAALISSVLAVQPGRAVGAVVGMALALAFGLVYGFALQASRPGWYLPYLWAAVLGAAGHIVWGLWEAYHGLGAVDYRLVTLAHPNATGTMMLLAVVLGIPWFLRCNDWRRWLGIPYVLGAAVVMVLTYSRGSWLGLLAFVACGLWPAWRSPVLRRYGQAVLIGFVVLLISMVLLVPGAAERVQSFLNLADDARVGVYQASWEMFLDHFWFGIGPANFDNYWDVYNKGRVEEAVGFPHNTWLQVLAETGIIGGVLFLLIVARLVAAVWRLRETSDFTLWLLASGVAAILVRDQVDTVIFTVHTGLVFWWMAGTVLAGERVERGLAGVSSGHVP